MKVNYSTQQLATAWFQVYREYGLSDHEAFFRAQNRLYLDPAYNPDEIEREALFHLICQMVKEGKTEYGKLLVDTRYHLKYGAGKN